MCMSYAKKILGTPNSNIRLKSLTRFARLVLSALIWISVIFPADSFAIHPSEAVINTIPPDRVKRILDAGENLILIDLRPLNEFRDKRLPKAHSIPSAEIEKRVREIPKIGRVVLYCNCQTNELVEKAFFLQNQGYRNIAVMPEGYLGWVKLGYPLEDGRQ